jgi:hypothetical protein
MAQVGGGEADNPHRSENDAEYAWDVEGWGKGGGGVEDRQNRRTQVRSAGAAPLVTLSGHVG